MVSRRGYIAAGISSLGMLWYGLTQNPLQDTDRNTNSADQEYVKSIIEKSGDSVGLTEVIKIPKSTVASVITASAKTDSKCEMYLIEQNGISYERVLTSTDNEYGENQTINVLQPGEYTISVKGQVSDWNIKIANYGSLPSGNEVENIPIDKNSSNLKVYGPIAINPYPKTSVKFQLQSPSDNESVLSLIQFGERYRRINLLSIPPGSTEQKKYFGRLSGVGFVQIRSDTEWNMSITQENST